MPFKRPSGLAVAIVVTLILISVFYSISVLDLKIVEWTPENHA